MAGWTGHAVGVSPTHTDAPGSNSNEQLAKTNFGTRREIQALQIATFVSMIFVMCNTPKVILAYSFLAVPDLSLFHRFENIYYVVNILRNTVEYINTSLNMFVYLRFNTNFLVWSDWGERPRIERSGLLGQNRVILVDRDILQPRGLAVDYKTDTVYWVDPAKGSVEAVQIDGTRRKVFHSDEGTFFYGVALYDDYLFVTEKNRGSLKVFNKQKSLVSFTLGNSPYDIIMYDSSQQPGNSNACLSLRCEQICVFDSVRGPTCVCGDGYVADGETSAVCKPTKAFVHPSHIYAIRDAICQYPANLADMSLTNITLDSQCFLEDKQGYTTLAYDARENMLYYFANNTKVINRITLEMGGRAQVVTGGSGEVKGMALDWVSGNLYWTDSTNGVIKVAKKSGAHQRILLSNLNNPVAIAIHPGRGEIYWTDHGHLPDIGGKVERAFMDGSGRNAILEVNIGQPNHMFVDYDKNILYWADSILYHIRKFDLVSGKTEILYEQPNVKFYGLSFFKDYVLWTDTEDLNGIHLARLDKKEKVRGIIHPKNGIAADLITFDIQNQPDMNNSCSEGSNKCNQLCLVSSSNKPVCQCGSGFVLSTYDGMTCQTGFTLVDNFILVNDAYQKKMFQVDLQSAVAASINIFPANEPVAVTYDPFDFKVIWSDNKQNVIKQVNIDGQYEKTIMYLTNVSNCDGLAADYINKLLFISDTGKDVIAVVSMLTNDYYANLITTDLEEPRDIAVSPNEGVFYWSDWGSKPVIERANMDGTNREVIIDLKYNSWPNGIALDYEGNNLYWVDAQSDTINVINLATKVSTVIMQEPGAHYFSLDVSGDFLYVSDWRKNYLRKMNKNGGQLQQFGEAMFTKIHGIKIFNSSESFKGVSVCVASACEHLCLPKAGNLFSCRCSEGFIQNGPVCIKAPSTSPAAATSTFEPNTTQSQSTDSPMSSISTTRLPNTMMTYPFTDDSSLDYMETDTTFEPIDSTDLSQSRISERSTSTTTADSPSSRMSQSTSSPAMTQVTDEFSSDYGDVDTTSEPIDSNELSTLVPDSATELNQTDQNPRVSYSTAEVSQMSPLLTGVIVGTVILVVSVIVLIVAALTWRRYKYKPRHGRLIEDQTPTDFYTIAFSAPGDEAVRMDDNTGIENPIYDCLNDPTIVINRGSDPTTPICSDLCISLIFICIFVYNISVYKLSNVL
ncbi:hypothetical protein Btru_038157 [Bulinus truncatus]|nr:hypothetical protein Btru_038157 [Bulinus truncatus]